MGRQDPLLCFFIVCYVWYSFLLIWGTSSEKFCGVDVQMYHFYGYCCSARHYVLYIDRESFVAELKERRPLSSHEFSLVNNLYAAGSFNNCGSPTTQNISFLCARGAERKEALAAWLSWRPHPVVLPV